MGGGFSKNFLPFPNGPWCDLRAPRFRATAGSLSCMRPAVPQYVTPMSQ